MIKIAIYVHTQNIKTPKSQGVINNLSNNHEIGTYIIQECTGDSLAYRTTIMRLMIRS